MITYNENTWFLFFTCYFFSRKTICHVFHLPILRKLGNTSMEPAIRLWYFLTAWNTWFLFLIHMLFFFSRKTICHVLHLPILRKLGNTSMEPAIRLWYFLTAWHGTKRKIIAEILQREGTWLAFETASRQNTFTTRSHRSGPHPIPAYT